MALELRLEKRRSWIALVAAYALVFQALLAGFGIGTSTAAGFDPGAVICSPGGTSHNPDRSNGHSEFPDCCATGCSMFWPTQSAGPAPFASPPRTDTAISRAPAALAFFLLPRDISSAHPRAPPSAT